MEKRSAPLRIVFMGSPDFAVPSLIALYDDPRFAVAAVYSMPDRPKGRGHRHVTTPVKATALEHNSPVHTPTSFRNDQAVVDQLKSYAPDFLVVVAYGLILPETVLQIPTIGAINLHASLLPKLRGPAPIHFSIMNGDPCTGNTVMLMSRKMDEGDILAAQNISIGKADTISILHDRLRDQGAPFLCDTLIKFADGILSPSPQNHELATYTTKISKDLAHLDWRKKAPQLEHLTRAMTPCPGAWFSLNESRFKVGAVRIGAKTNAQPGTVIAISAETGIQIACGSNTSLHLLSLQRPGKSMMSIADFLRGYQFDAKILPVS